MRRASAFTLMRAGAFMALSPVLAVAAAPEPAAAQANVKRQDRDRPDSLRIGRAATGLSSPLKAKQSDRWGGPLPGAACALPRPRPQRPPLREWPSPRGARLTAPAAALDHQQPGCGCRRGGIVKMRGDTRIILRRGRRFTISRPEAQ